MKHKVFTTIFTIIIALIIGVLFISFKTDAITNKTFGTNTAITTNKTENKEIFKTETILNTDISIPSTENTEETQQEINTKPTMPPPTETSPEEDMSQKPTKPMAKYTEVNEIVYAISTVNVRTEPNTDCEKIGSLKKGESIIRIGVGDNDWSKVEYNNEIRYIHSSYLSITKPVEEVQYPLIYSDETCKITIYKEWFKNAWCYAAHIEFTDYERLSTECANGKYNNGYETTSHCANRLGAIFAVNGCYSAPYLNYTVIRNGKICNGSGRNLCLPAVYSGKNGLLLSAWESGGTQGIVNKNVDMLVTEGLATDSFCFGPPNLQNGVISGTNGGSRAQRTFIGTNGNAGDVWIVVSDGRYNDGISAGLTGYETAEYLLSKGCTFGVNLDGGGSSTMYFNGEVLNANKNNERAVVDFLYFK